MRKDLILLPLLLVTLVLPFGCQRGDTPEPEGRKPTAGGPAKTATLAPASAWAAEADEPRIPEGCSPEFRAFFDHAVVEMRGRGDLDVTVVTDPLCWHCRLANKLLGEYPELYGRLRLSFFPRRSFIGSDMAAWILEDAAGTDRLPKLVEFAYGELKQPKVEDIMEARMLVLVQFTRAFPELLGGAPIEELYVRLQKAHESHVLEGAALAHEAHLPGTPILIAGDKVVLGFAPAVWLKVLKEAAMCK